MGPRRIILPYRVPRKNGEACSDLGLSHDAGNALPPDVMRAALCCIRATGIPPRGWATFGAPYCNGERPECIAIRDRAQHQSV